MATKASNVRSPPQSKSPPPTTNIAPWEDPPSDDAISPWDQDPQAQVVGSRPFNQPYFNNSANRDGKLSPFNPENSRTNISDSPPEFDADARRPSVASATTVSSHGSKQSHRNSRFHKSLKGFFGDDPDASKSSLQNLPEQFSNGGPPDKNGDRQGSGPAGEERDNSSQPTSQVTPWDYQNFDDVSNFGSAPVRQEPLAENGMSGKGKGGLIHRPSKSKEESRHASQAPTSASQRPNAYRDISMSSMNQRRNQPQNSTPMSSTSNFDKVPNPATNKKEAAPPEKRSLFSKVKNKIKDKTTSGSDSANTPSTTMSPPPPVKSVESPQSRNRAVSNQSQTSTNQPEKKDRESSVASIDSAITIKPDPPTPKIDRVNTTSSKMSRFSRHSKARQQSIKSDTSDRSRMSVAPPPSAPTGMFSLDTNFDDMSDIVSAPAPPKSPGEAGIFTGKVPSTPSTELPAPVWDAPDSWAVKATQDETIIEEANEDGLPPIEEEDGISYFMRVFRTDGTFATLSMTINATVKEILQSLAKKSVLHDDIDRYQLLLRKHQLARQLLPNERPIAMQKNLLLQAGYAEQDHIEDVGRDDNSYLIRFTFSHEKQTGFGSGLDNDPTFKGMQKFSHVDLQGKSLVTIPIVLYLKAQEIISLNLSRNLALSVPKDFITACTNLREIKFTGNEATRLPISLASASRLSVLDASNNRLEQLEHAEIHRMMGLVSLKLANNNLTELPANYSHFRQLRSLNLSSNNFTKFPEHICSLRSLVDLDMSFNKLSSLPKISQLTTLERLWITNNDLKGPLNESFKSLTNLKEIDARFNGVTNVDTIVDLPNLEQLLIGHNNISSFTGSFKKLRVFLLDHCPVTTFEITAAMPTLLTLNIASAKLVDFKETMFDFVPNLQKLVLDKNHLSTMSPQIGRLSKLEYLSMAKNPLKVVPPSVGNLGELRSLNIRECNVSSLPPEIWYCKKLETLNVSSNVLESFPKQNAAPPPPDLREESSTPGLSQSPSFEELGKLEDFQARRPSQASGMYNSSSPNVSGRKNSLASVSGSGHRKTSVISRTNTEASMPPVTRKDSNLSQVRLQNTFAGSLRYLYLAYNRLEDEVFRELVLLPELRVLNLSYNELDDFPQGVLRRWPQMTELYLSGNELTSLPSDDLEENSNLRVLHLNANRFQVLPAELCNVHKLSTLDVGSNSLKYNVSNWPYDWNWNRNTNLKYLNFSANRRLEIKPAANQNQAQFNSMNNDGPVDLTSFNTLKYLRVLGLMDVTLLINTIPDDTDDRRVRTSASLIGAIMYGMADTLGKNEHLSTLDLLKPNFRGHEAEVLVGMFDGQTMSSGGSRIAKYLHENFPGTFQDELARIDKTEDTPTDALRRTFLAINKDMANFASSNLDDREYRMVSSQHRTSTVANVLGSDDLNSGGVACVLYLDGTELYVANVGDVEAVLIQSNGQHRQLTRKHDPAEPKERERIRNAGGYVSRQGKLNDQLEVSRAFGYYGMMPSVIAAPYTFNCTLSEIDELIVMASKEFWDFVTVDVAIDVARADKNDLMLAAQKLRDLAIAFGARDKITVMVLGIADIRKRNNSRFRGTSLSMAKELGGDDGQIFPSSRRTRRGGGTLAGDSKLARLAETEPPVGHVAICFTDIKNSTALWEILPVPMRSAIMMHNELMRRQLRILGGYEVKTEGDAFMVSFSTVTSALLWCFSCQQHLLELAWPSEILDTIHCQEKFDGDGNTIYRGLSVRMGIHYGRPVCEQDPITRRMDYFGPMVNKAARVSGVADGGQITVSNDFITEMQRTMESFAEEDRRDSVGSQDTVNDEGVSAQIRRELRQLSSQGFEVKDLGEKKLKGLENPEYLYLMYPHSLAGRLTVPPGAETKVAMGGETVAEGDKNQPGSMGKDSELYHGLDLDEVWKLWDVGLRLEMLCSCLESPERAEGLRKPELSLLTRMKEKGGTLSDQFLLNLLEHQVTRVESCITTLQLRHMIRPFKKGVELVDQAQPIAELLAQMTSMMHAMKQGRR